MIQALPRIDDEIKSILINKKKPGLIKDFLIEYVKTERDILKDKFIQTLIDLHVEVNNLGKNKNKNKMNKNESRPFIVAPPSFTTPSMNTMNANNNNDNGGYCNCHCQNCFNPQFIRYKPY